MGKKDYFQEGEEKMIFQNIDFHNVSELIETEKGRLISRFPKSLTARLDEGSERSARYASGVELRFKMNGDRAVLKLRADPAAEAQTLYLYYGDFQGGWQYSAKTIGTKETDIEIGLPQNIRYLRELARKGHAAFQPDVVRVLLPYGTCYFLGAEGDIEAPGPQDSPKKTYLAYGSSITHGSLALAPPYTYTARIARRFHCDYLNFGTAGCCHAEKAMAEYIVSRKDWDFASAELGINMLRGFSESEFAGRVEEFLRILNSDPRPVFVTDIFGFSDPEGQEKAMRFRKIVRDLAARYDHLVYTCGLDLLNDPYCISADLTHPALEGVEQIAERWSELMERYLM
ncbi:MAG: SGNH/GDSL hydrolase family protein [Lachnospiraceae bacterium]|jgi:hypothetical protein